MTPSALSYLCRSTEVFLWNFFARCRKRFNWSKLVWNLPQVSASRNAHTEKSIGWSRNQVDIPTGWSNVTHCDVTQNWCRENITKFWSYGTIQCGRFLKLKPVANFRQVWTNWNALYSEHGKKLWRDGFLRRDEKVYGVRIIRINYM